MSTTQNTGKKISKVMDVPGLLECTFNHVIASSDASFKWTGPKIPKAEWQKVLAFFRWTYSEHNSESQVRLYVNHITRQWAAWAFPQKARTGMTATELDTDETKTQRQQFKDSEGWTYFGTVHHHCSMSAFQSGTDTDNEKDQDGLHITVGKMDEEQYDIHHRTYIGGFKMLMVKLTDFWDIEPDIAELPKNVQKMLKGNVELLAMAQMGTPPPEDFAFPEQWKENVIEEKPVVVQGSAYNPHWSHTSYSGPQRKFWRNRVGLYESDKTKAVRFMKALLLSEKDNQMTLEDCVITVGSVVQTLDDLELELLDIMFQCDLDLNGLVEAVKDESESQARMKQAQGEPVSIRTNGKKGKGKQVSQSVDPVEQAELELERRRLIAEGGGITGWEGYGH